MSEERTIWLMDKMAPASHCKRGSQLLLLEAHQNPLGMLMRYYGSEVEVQPLLTEGLYEYGPTIWHFHLMFVFAKDCNCFIIPFTLFSLFLIWHFVVKVYVVISMYQYIPPTEEDPDQLSKLGDLQKVHWSAFSCKWASHKVSITARALTLVLSYSWMFQSDLSDGLFVVSTKKHHVIIQLEWSISQYRGKEV